MMDLASEVLKDTLVVDLFHAALPLCPSSRTLSRFWQASTTDLAIMCLFHDDSSLLHSVPAKRSDARVIEKRRRKGHEGREWDALGIHGGGPGLITSLLHAVRASMHAAYAYQTKTKVVQYASCMRDDRVFCKLMLQTTVYICGTIELKI